MLDKARAIFETIVDLRRDIHRHPELGYRETRTARRVCEVLDELGIGYQSGVAGTGVVADLKKGEGPTVAIRADMDALPVTENTGLPFASEQAGVMHACGHDAHTAMALGAARLLSGADFQGTVRFLFQPAEEDNYDDPDGYSGAERMVVEGALEGVRAAVALHQIPTMDSGTINIKAGPIMAAADIFKITVKGRAAHAGAAPEQSIDAVVIAAELVSLLQTVVSRNVSPMETAVVSVCTVNGGHAPNVIADQVTLTGTTRALNDATRETVLNRIQSICDNLAAMHGAQIEFGLTHSNPLTANDPEVAAVAARAARTVFGEAGVIDGRPIMAGEDFSYMARAVPACFALLGTRPEEGEAHGLHSSQMILNENALPYGAAWLAQSALELLRHYQQA